MKISPLQYNTTELWHRSSYRKFRSARARIGGADAVALQSYCLLRTCSRSLHSNCLGRSSNPYSPHCSPSVL